MADFDLNSYFITDAKTDFVVDAKGQIFTGADGQPVKLGSAIVSGIVALIGVAVQVTSTAMSLKQQKQFLEAQQRYLNAQTGVVKSLKSSYGGYNQHSFELRQQIENMKSEIKNRMDALKLSGFDFVSEEKRLGGLIQNGYEELNNNGFSQGIFSGVDSIALMLKSSNFSDAEKRQKLEQFLKQLDVYGLVLVGYYTSAGVFGEHLAVRPKCFQVTGTEKATDPALRLYPASTAFIYGEKTKLPGMGFTLNESLTPSMYGNGFKIAIETLRDIGAPSWVYRAMFDGPKVDRNTAKKMFYDGDFSSVDLFSIGYNRSKSDFTIVQNFVNGYNQQTYEEMMRKIAIKTDPYAEINRIEKEIAAKRESIAKLEIDREKAVAAATSNAARAGISQGFSKSIQTLKNDIAKLESEKAFAQAAIVKEGGTVTDKVTGETVDSSTKTVIGTGKTPEEIERAAGIAKQQEAMKSAAAARSAGMNKQNKNSISVAGVSVPPLVIAAAAGAGAYMIAKG